jgi:hypothetical protein
MFAPHAFPPEARGDHDRQCRPGRSGDAGMAGCVLLASPLPDAPSERAFLPPDHGLARTARGQQRHDDHDPLFLLASFFPPRSSPSSVEHRLFWVCGVLHPSPQTHFGDPSTG